MQRGAHIIQEHPPSLGEYSAEVIGDSRWSVQNSNPSAMRTGVGDIHVQRISHNTMLLQTSYNAEPVF